MSGPTKDKQLYESYDGQIQWTEQKVADLRHLADWVEDGGMYGENPEYPQQQIANLLRAKADKIEAARRTIHQQTHSDYNELVKAIQYYRSGDYGPEQINEAWENYGER